MKYLSLIIISLALLGGCAVPADYEERYSYGGDSYSNDGFYRYDSSVRNGLYDNYNSRRAHRSNNIGSHDRYNSYNGLGHSLDTSRYGNYHHGNRRHSYHSNHRRY